MVQETMVDAIVLEYEAKLEFLEATLKSNIYSERVRTVLLLCSTENTVAVFATIRNRTLESPLVRWLVIANENITASLISVLREGTQVAVATHTASRAHQIFTSYISVEDEVRFKLIENWEPPESTALQSNPRSPKNQIRDPTSTKGKDPESHQSLEGYYLFPDLDSIYDDFQGRRLLAAVVSNVPYFVLDDLADGTVIPVSGIDYEILRALGARLNFT
ncbi:uncharacterized protein LOC135222515 [Macrobrachium nipponense]|uniref:uncharacterized protein LOC135222515 n=1 Tax=Macrobrachium nipponense TaxID=159736 RepID=UPI0030C7F0F1